MSDESSDETFTGFDFTPLQQGAASMHELYQTFIGAGFSEEQAFTFLHTLWQTTIQAMYR